MQMYKLCTMTLVLAPRTHLLSRSPIEELEAPEVMQDAGAPPGVRLDVLLGQPTRTLIRIEDRRQRAVGKPQRKGEALSRLKRL